MSTVQQATDAYLALLTPTFAKENHALLLEQSLRHHLFSGDRPFCSVLMPLFVDSGFYRSIKQKSALILSAIQKVRRLAEIDSQVLELFHLTEMEKELFSLGVDGGYALAIGRLDAFVQRDGSFKFVEFNAESPGGIIFGDVLAELFLRLPVMHEFQKKFAVSIRLMRRRVLDVLLEEHGRSGARSDPVIGIVDVGGVLTHGEFLLCRDYFAERGVETVIGKPEEAEFVNDALYIQKRRIDVLYRRIVTADLIETDNPDHPVIQAAKSGKTRVVSSFKTIVMHKKVMFAILSNPVFKSLFTPREIAAVRAHIPWTRVLEETSTTFGGRTVDLIPFLRAEKDRFVLKSPGDYGGRHIYLGWKTAAGDWDTALELGLGNRFVIQERVDLTKVPFPTVVDGNLKTEERFFDIDPYVWGDGQVDGCGVRVSGSEILNVTAGSGSAVPMMILD